MSIYCCTHIRWNILLSFAPLDDVASESKHFKEQNINHQLEQLTKSYKDISAGNVERLQSYQTQLSELFEWAKSGQRKVLDFHSKTHKKAGQKEESEFWEKLRKPAEVLVLKIEE